MQKHGKILHAANAASYGKGDGYGPSYLSYRVDHDAAVFGAGVDVQEDQFIHAGRVVDRGAFRRIAGILHVLKLHALDHAAVTNVQRGNNALCQHALHPLFADSGEIFQQLAACVPTLFGVKLNGPKGAVPNGDVH